MKWRRGGDFLGAWDFYCHSTIQFNFHCSWLSLSVSWIVVSQFFVTNYNARPLGRLWVYMDTHIRRCIMQAILLCICNGNSTHSFLNLKLPQMTMSSAADAFIAFVFCEKCHVYHFVILFFLLDSNFLSFTCKCKWASQLASYIQHTIIPLQFSLSKNVCCVCGANCNAASQKKVDKSWSWILDCLIDWSIPKLKDPKNWRQNLAGKCFDQCEDCQLNMHPRDNTSFLMRNWLVD